MDLMPNNQNGNQQNIPGNNQNNPNNPNRNLNSNYEQPPYYGIPVMPVIDPSKGPDDQQMVMYMPVYDPRYYWPENSEYSRYTPPTDKTPFPNNPDNIVPYYKFRPRMTTNPIGFRTSDADSDTYNRMLKNSIYMNDNVSEPEYLVDHITEELEGANDYMAKALEWKGKDPTISKKFYKMAETEVEHANCLTKMFTSMKQSKDISEEEYNKMYKEILRAYEDEMNKLESAKKLYRS